MIVKEKIIAAMKSDFIKEVYCFDVLGSTNAYGIAYAKGQQGPISTVIVTEMQTEGRGQKQRVFHSPRGGVYMSIVFHPQTLQYEQIQYLTIAGVMAAADAVEALYEISVDVKWLNDMYLEHKKFSGILLEAGYSGKVMEYAVLGIGINTATIEIPKELEQTITTLADHTEKVVEKEQLIATICDNFSGYLSCIEQSDYTFMEAYRTRNFLIGMQIRLANDTNIYSVDGISDTGALCITDCQSKMSKELQAGSIQIIDWKNEII